MNPRDGGFGPMMNHPYLVENGHRHADHPFGWLVMFIVLALVVALIVWVVLRVMGSRVEQAQPSAPGTSHDDALDLVRMRYARGEIDREVFLRTTADLGGAPEPLPAPSAPPEPPPAPSAA